MMDCNRIWIRGAVVVVIYHFYNLQLRSDQSPSKEEHFTSARVSSGWSATLGVELLVFSVGLWLGGLNFRGTLLL